LELLSNGLGIARGDSMTKDYWEGYVPEPTVKQSLTVENPRFDGSDYVRARDDVRLKGQLLRVWELMSDGKWRTLGEIARSTGDPESSISAQLRHLRKERFGAHTIEKEYKDFGLFVYRLIKNDRA